MRCRSSFSWRSPRSLIWPARVMARVRELVSRRFLEHAEQRALGPGGFDRLVDQVADTVIDPYTAAERILDRAVRGAAADAAGPRSTLEVG